MMDAGGEGGLGVDIGIVYWKPNYFLTRDGAELFFEIHKNQTDGAIHTVENGYIVFTEKEII